MHAHPFRAQYKAGKVGGLEVPGYQDEMGVEPDSVTEAYAAGGWGPIEVNRLFDGEDTEWRNGV